MRQSADRVLTTHTGSLPRPAPLVEMLRRREAEAASAARTNLVSGMASALAHEINQPMTAARALARAAQQLLRIPNADLPRAERNLGELVAQIDHAGGVVRRMRDFLRRGEPHVSTIDVRSMLNDTVALLGSSNYASLRKVYARLADAVGAPPFTVTVGKEKETVATFDGLRATALDAAKQGIQVSRFKGLGEMNEDQLWETTMDPARRLLIRVDVEDAHDADLVFSTLMGDQVEPRRAFIQQNAKDVKFLDV